jgi:hypothetical protein
MTEILLARHAQAYANQRDFAAFGNRESPLTDHGIEQTKAMNQAFRSDFDIIPEEYPRPVLASTFVRPQQTARLVGFNVIDISSKIDEARVDEEVMSGINPVEKHANERWVPDSLKEPVASFLDEVQGGSLRYEIYFTHGMFIAGVVLECEARGIDHGIPFDAKRGYAPLQAAITKLVV